MRITDINIKGTIIPNEDKQLYEFFGIESTCPKDVTENLEREEQLDIYINSGGGDIFAAAEIYSAIQKHKDKVKIHVVGLAASAASVIMCAAENDISAASMVMIHNVSTIAQGDFKDFKHESERLRKADRAMCQAYIDKSGKSESDFLPLMDKETWFTAQEAVDIGLCDKIAGRELLINSHCTIATDEQRKQFENAKAKAAVQIRLEKIKSEVKA